MAAIAAGKVTFMSDNNRWALRDIRLGKTYFFENWCDLVRFVTDENIEKPVVARKDNSNV